MKIFCTNSNEPLIQAVGQWLGKIHSVNSVNNFFLEENQSKILMKNSDLVIHSLSNDMEIGEKIKLEESIEQTYKLLSLCIEMGIKKFLFLGTLDVLKAYDPDYIIDEMWKPKPTTEIKLLTNHMAEFVCKEFGREHNVDVRVLRLGEICWENKSNSDSPLFIIDALQAIQRTVEADLPSPSYIPNVPNTWNVFHIQSLVPNMRFKIVKAIDELGYDPQKVEL
jgi:hypothetical protein